uniref:Uncharacterized protein n=1 Tax=Oryza rufipogon TaxID=4529 RepID=A0A0E0NNN8_ORYRU
MLYSSLEIVKASGAAVQCRLRKTLPELFSYTRHEWVEQAQADIDELKAASLSNLKIIWIMGRYRSTRRTRPGTI